MRACVRAPYNFYPDLTLLFDGGCLQVSRARKIMDDEGRRLIRRRDFTGPDGERGEHDAFCLDFMDVLVTVCKI